MRINYSATFNGYNAARPMKDYVSYRYSLESGFFMNLASLAKKGSYRKTRKIIEDGDYEG